MFHKNLVKTKVSGIKYSPWESISTHCQQHSTIDEVQGINNCDNEEEKKDCPTTDDVSVSQFHKQHSQKNPKIV